MSRNDSDRELPAGKSPGPGDSVEDILRGWQELRAHLMGKGFSDPGAMDRDEAMMLLMAPETTFKSEPAYTGALRLPPEEVLALYADLDGGRADEDASDEDASDEDAPAESGEIRALVLQEGGEWMLHVATTGGVNQGWLALVVGPAPDEMTCVTRPRRCHGDGEPERFPVPRPFVGAEPQVQLYACQFEDLDSLFGGRATIRAEDFKRWVADVGPQRCPLTLLG